MFDVVFLDIDGVLTDGAVYVDTTGKETKRILFDDIDAIFELKRAGIKIGFITGEKNDFCRYVKERFSPDFFLDGCKDKLKAFKDLSEKHNLDKNKICYAGDSKKDIELLSFLEYSYTPSDSGKEVRNSAKTILETPRGHGVIRELAERILQMSKKLS